MMFHQRLRSGLVVALGISLMLAPMAPAFAADSLVPPGTAFNYQGRLNDGGHAAKGIFTFKFRLYDQSVGGTQIGGEVEIPATQINDGFFSFDLDFGSVYADGKRWLEVVVDGTTLSPRQAIMPTPVALYALSGNEGPQGDKGDTGEAGPKGDKGDAGAAGADGAAGAKGDKGDTGATGAAGAKGDKGDTGATGAAGAKGDQGDVGPAGPKGDKGDAGTNGVDGAPGLKGDKGDTGEAGPKGDKGDAGEAGPKGD